MAVQQVSGKAFTVGQGRSAVAASAYRGGHELTNEHTGEVFDYRVKGENNVEHSEVILPKGTAPRFYDPETLWNAAERAEQDRDGNWKKLEYNEDGSIKKGPCVARELLICFPEEFAGPEHKEIRMEMARQYAAHLIDNHKVAVEISLHAPGNAGDERNYHCHVQYSDRRMEAHGFEHPTKKYKTGPDAGKPWASEKVTEMKFNGRGREPEAFIAAKAAWSNITSMALEKAGHHIEAQRWEHAHLTKREQGDRALERGDIEHYQECLKAPKVHMGPAATAMEREFAKGEGRGKLSEMGDRNRAISQEDQDKLGERRAEWIKIMQDPKYLVDLVSHKKAVFDHTDLGRAFFDRCETDRDAQFFQNVMAKAKADPRLVQLTEETRIDGKRTAEKFTTLDTLTTEKQVLANAANMRDRRTFTLDPKKIDNVLANYPTMSDEQKNYVRGIAEGGRGYASLIGDAGTGKSFSQKALKEIFEANGYRVIGTALSSQAAGQLQSGSGIESGTLKSMLYRLKTGQETLDDRTIVIVDEAGMIGNKMFAELQQYSVGGMSTMIAAGDSKQLEAIDAGSPFRLIVERQGADYELTKVMRQNEQWQKDASEQMARGDFKAGMDAYNERGFVHMPDTRAEAIKALSSMYVDNIGATNSKGEIETQIVTTFTKADVRAVNDAIRAEIKARDPEKLKDGIKIETYYGEREFATGDQIRFRVNDKNLGAKIDKETGRKQKNIGGKLGAKISELSKTETGVRNGDIGKIEKIADGKISVRLKMDKEGKSVDRLITFETSKYNTFDHGYAGTGHAGQGASETRAYTLYSKADYKALRYVENTRHKNEFHAFGSKEVFKNYESMVKRGSRENLKESALDYQKPMEALQAKREQERAAEKGPAPAQESTTPVSRLARDMAFAERREAEHKQSALDRVLSQAAGQTKEPKQSALDRALDAKQQAKEPAQQQKKNRGIDM